MNLEETFEKHSDQEHMKFERIPEKDRRHPRPDLCGMIYLHEKIGGTGDMLVSAEHDEVYFDFNDGGKTAKRLAEEDVIYLLRCGIFYSESGLMKFV